MEVRRSWSVYDDGEPLRERDAYLAVVDPLGALVGFACMGTQARVPGISADPGVLDLGLGMRPDLVGRGRGRIVAEAVLAHCAQASSAQTARACIQPWNVRSRRLASSVGFSEVGEHTCLQDGRQVAYIVLVAPLHRLD